MSNKKGNASNWKYCPICWQEKSGYEYHHVVWRTDGGSDDPKNLLRICKTCHAIITWGCSEDAIPKDMACFSFQLATYGLAFLLKSGIIFSDNPVWGKSFVEKYGDISTEIIDQRLMASGDVLYEKYLEQIKDTHSPES